MFTAPENQKQGLKFSDHLPFNKEWLAQKRISNKFEEFHCLKKMNFSELLFFFRHENEHVVLASSQTILAMTK